MGKFMPQSTIKNSGDIKLGGDSQLCESNKSNCRSARSPERTKEREAKSPPAVRTTSEISLKSTPEKEYKIN